MRGDKQPYPPGRGMRSLIPVQDRVYKGACAALAFGAGNMDNIQSIKILGLGHVRKP